MYHLFLGLDYLIGLMLVIMGIHLHLQAMDRDWSRQSQITFPINCFFQNRQGLSQFPSFFFTSLFTLFQESPLVRWVANGPNLTTSPCQEITASKQNSQETVLQERNFL